MTNTSTPNAEIRAALRRLAELQRGEQPETQGGAQDGARASTVVSAYLDLRPEDGNPQVRSGLVVLRDTLRDGDAGDDLLDTITAHVENELLPEARGAAVFAADGTIVETVVTGGQIADDVRLDERARLLPLARLADTEGVLVALADTNTLRIFALRGGELIETGLLDDDSAEYTAHAQGGWSQARFQRHIEENREAFADLAAQALEGMATIEDASVLIICADEVAAPLLRDALSKRLADMHRATLRLGIRASYDEIAELVMPEIERIRAEDARDAAERAIGAAKADGMGIYGAEATRRALELGQVSELLLDSGPDAMLQDETAEDLVHLAALTDARVRFVEHEMLRQNDGVAGFLRFRLDRAINEPIDEVDSPVEGAATVSPTGEPISSAS